MQVPSPLIPQWSFMSFQGAIRQRYKQLQGQPWTEIKVDRQVLTRLLTTYAGEATTTFHARFDETYGSGWNKIIRETFTYDWLASVKSGELGPLTATLPDECLYQYQCVYRYFTNFLKNCTDKHRSRNKSYTLDAISDPNVKARRSARRQRAS